MTALSCLRPLWPLVLAVAAVGVAPAPLAASAVQAASDWTWDLPDYLPPPRVPADNPMTQAKVALGRYLFYDKRLSGNGTQAKPFATLDKALSNSSGGTDIYIGPGTWPAIQGWSRSGTASSTLRFSVRSSKSSNAAASRAKGLSDDESSFGKYRVPQTRHSCVTSPWRRRDKDTSVADPHEGFWQTSRSFLTSERKNRKSFSLIDHRNCEFEFHFRLQFIHVSHGRGELLQRKVVVFKKRLTAHGAFRMTAHLQDAQRYFR